MSVVLFVPLVSLWTLALNNSHWKVAVPSTRVRVQFDMWKTWNFKDTKAKKECKTAIRILVYTRIFIVCDFGSSHRLPNIEGFVPSLLTKKIILRWTSSLLKRHSNEEPEELIRSRRWCTTLWWRRRSNGKRHALWRTHLERCRGSFRTWRHIFHRVLHRCRLLR
jgi:hypothetical protein